MGQPEISMDLLKLKALDVLGRGAKGVVFLVQNQDHPREIFALKAVSKASIEKKNNEDGFKRLWFERDVLTLLDHPLLPKLHGFFLTEKIVGLLMEHCSGGDLNVLRKRQTEKMFSDDIIRFYAAELVLVLEYLHGLGVVYRDLKPENVLIQGNGHLMLIDFDLSARLPVRKEPESCLNPVTEEEEELEEKNFDRKSFLLACVSSGRRKLNYSKSIKVKEQDPPEYSVPGADDSTGKSNSFVGTEDYVAPEIISGSGHDFAVDWWGLGVMMYEMLYGRTPFRGSNRKETFHRILTKQPDLVGAWTPLRDLIRRLLEKDPRKRISGEAVKRHDFFKGVEWESVLKISRPPFIPGDYIGAEKSEVIDVEEVVEEIRVIRETKENEEENKVETLENETHSNNGSDFLVF